MVDIDKHAEDLLSEARHTLTQGKECYPRAWFILPDGTIKHFHIDPELMSPIGRDGTDDRFLGKDLLAAYLQLRAQRDNAMVLFLTDAWVRRAGSKEEARILTERAVTHGLYDDPLRQEALIVSVFGPGVTPTSYSQFYQRDPATGAIVFEPVHKQAPVEGRFAPDMLGRGRKA
jgi:hypothetical protein